ncbi:TOMM precursor leader peptide-binding protein [Streptomyces bambusae]|uniref:TOMM leader peptide-binding protein n=1 Tax=Streptomyces bambusae TaxID=1550616 RepID=A0ABS6ZBW3_9ACTN|nr:TOMM precursor leader peptide-binding protein [Streptomyces bambusae]MBW5485260.1 TOMM precursor leader peptide-binding protein [Streptomyces bambusae]
MPRILRFKRSTNAQVLPGEGVFLVSEQRQTVLRGALAERLAPLLDGQHTREAILDALAPDFDADRVARNLDRLVTAGHVVTAEAGGSGSDTDDDERSGGFWELAGLDADQARRQLHAAPVEVVALGAADPAWFTGAARAMGLDPDAADPRLTVVLTDDYLHPDLADLNKRALASGRPWLLVRPVGTETWVGPLFQPGESGCWDCLAHRLAGNRLVTSFVQQSTGADRPPVTALAGLPGTVSAAAHLAAVQAAKWFAGIRGPELAEVFGLDTLTLEGRRHRLSRRPQCPSCGDPGIVARRALKPVELRSRTKDAAVQDGGHRTKDPARLLADHEHLVSPVTGVISQLVKQDSGTDLLHCYLAGTNFAVGSGGLDALRAGLRSQSSGKGMSDVQARASAVAESIERYSGVHQGDEARITASYRELGDDAVHPNAIQLYSDQQYHDRDDWNARGSHFHRVSAPFDEDARIEWTPVWSLTHRRHKYLPTAQLYYQYPAGAHPATVWSDSNGNAAGASLEDAAVQGFMELVERDSVALWWYNRVQRPELDLDSFAEPYFGRWKQAYRDLGRETWVLDLTSDLGIPVAAAVSRRTDKPVEDILLAFGAHFDMKIAVSRALTEMNQFIGAVLPMQSDGTGEYAFDDPDQIRWWSTATLENQPYLRPLPGPARTYADHPYRPSTDLLDDLERARRVVEERGLEMLVLDQTRPDIGLPVVKVIVPGLRHFWPRFAPGRLYDAPVRMGWLDTPTREEDLNPIGMFL